MAAGESMMEHISNRAKQQGALQDLPIVLRDLQRGLEYQLHGPASSGLLIDGFWKYVGIGLAQRSLQEMLGFKEAASPSLLLEVRTCFVSEKVAKSCGQFAEFSHLLHDAIVGTQEFANFVSWLDIPNRTWTIDRVYLNGVLPAGKRYGARAIAEHLLEPPLLFFQSQSSAQIGSFLDSMPDLEKLVVSDIVNCNTYLLMAVVGTSEAETNKKVGDVLGFALDTELNAAGLSRKMLFHGSVLEVFQSTVLGKMASGALAIWNEKLNRAIKMKSAEVVYGAGDEEIFGQRRPRMAVIVQLMEEHSEMRAKRRLGTDKVAVPKATEFDLENPTSPLEGMGACLEGVWGRRHSRVQLPAGTNGPHYFAGLSTAMTCLLHEMQVERGLSCRATAATGKAMTAVDRLKSQRGSTDRVLAQLSDLVQLAFGLMEKGVLKSRHKEVLAWHQEISVGIVLQRGLVNDAIKHTISTWMGRYATVCATPDTGYHVLIDKLLKSILKVIGLASEGLDLSPQPDPFGKVERLERCSLLLRFKEHIGRERGLLAAKGESRWTEEVEDRAKRIFAETTDGTDELLQSILDDKLLGHATESKALVDALTEMHGFYKKEVEQADFRIPAEKAVQWFEIFTHWIQFAYDHLQTELEALVEDLPEDNIAQPRVDVDLRVTPEEDAGGLYDQLRQSTNISSPETIFTREFLQSDPQVFFEAMQKIRADDVSPTVTHQFIKRLQEKNLLQRCYTQNIDCLERKVGIEPHLLVECHGTTANAKCDDCRKVCSKEVYFRNETPPKCSCGGSIRPDIVLFGETLPDSFQKLSKDDFQAAAREKCCLLIVMGTSLKVQPFASLPKLLKPSCAVLVINREFPQSLQLHRQVRALRSRLSGTKLRRHVFLAGDCDTSS
ncbi:unnamed protein product [Effrenium voratum]|uniref:Deacetylase sirtuin-type domain-containing protein n=1 Tax=Effrenium voratum TaxID=2562239 RepID=A0AA36IAR8_9DINO|nr:unnamed protein product [Effrenium voratum]